MQVRWCLWRLMSTRLSLPSDLNQTTEDFVFNIARAMQTNTGSICAGCFHPTTHARDSSGQVRTVPRWFETLWSTFLGHISVGVEGPPPNCPGLQPSHNTSEGRTRRGACSVLWRPR